MKEWLIALGLGLSIASCNPRVQEAPKPRTDTKLEQMIRIEKRISFEQAMKNQDLRQGYLEQILEGQGCEEIVGVRYDPTYSYYLDFCTNVGYKREDIVREIDEFIKARTKMAVPTNVAIIGAKCKHALFVFKPCFEGYIKTENEFLLEFEHECLVTKDFYYGIRVKDETITYKNQRQINPDTIRALAEIKVYYAHLKKIAEGKIKVNEQYLLSLSDNYLIFYRQLEETAKKNNYEGRIAKRQLELISYLIPIGLPNGKIIFMEILH